MISCYLTVLNQSLAQYLSFYGTEFNNSKVGQVGIGSYGVKETCLQYIMLYK